MNLSPVRTAALSLAAAFAALGAAQPKLWGSFDASRLTYADSALTSPGLAYLRTFIVAHGGAVGDATSVLTPEYLSDKDVFFTGYLHLTNGVLSSQEQVALHDWIAGGRTLVVTADGLVNGMPSYNSFTGFYGVNNYRWIQNPFGNFRKLADHRTTEDVTSTLMLDETQPVYFSYGADALVVVESDTYAPFVAVMEPGTGFTAGGRILIVGDHLVWRSKPHH